MIKLPSVATRKPITKKDRILFAGMLLRWNNESNLRNMPWKGEKDPYKIWLSEVILQQTRVEQGLSYYQKFVSAFPSVQDLAAAPDQLVFKYWEGLGYYSRCRNLIETARHIARDLNGQFPSRYQEIIKLKGVGPYTAAAIASFAFKECHAVVDGNVFRVISRIFGVDKAIDTSEGKKFFAGLAGELLHKELPDVYNQAIMDFGAMVCKPVPVCDQCPFKSGCRAFLNGEISALPVKSRKVYVKKRCLHYVLLEYNGRFAIRQRTDRDIWSDLFEFMLIESKTCLSKVAIVSHAKRKGWLANTGYELVEYSRVFRQQLTHQIIEGRFARIKLRKKPVTIQGLIWVKKEQIISYAFPKFINNYLAECGLI